ncbi:hypothetical protein [Exiguobacterium sp. SH0S2]|uniref:hypothetical protein n=1 Tax=Exiguobacterium sp. SH0S2 TaxID=2510950 RepID=UPI0010389A09|nr:hypothetical protein [Exiguobacterium sp. SH0S2]TCI63201.1 hypothetical protein EVJ21_06735 [Exiguobacterium sp. SH0S2]
MAIAVGYIIACIGAFVAYWFSTGESRKKKYKIWGIALMLPISPALAFSIGLSYAISVENGWAGLIMWLIFPIIFLIGLTLLLVGIFKKEKTIKSNRTSST